MKKLYSIIVTLFLGFFGMQAQEMSVQSFALAETDLTANTPGTMKHDQSGYVSALIKVETTQKGFTFDVGMLGVVDVIEEPGEIWVYVPFGVRKITIRHPQLGVLRDYQFPCAIEKGRTYVLRLNTVSGSVTHDSSRKQKVRMMLYPASADLEINGIPMPVDENGVFEQELSFGHYEIVASAPKYHSKSLQVEVTDQNSVKELTLRLDQAFGWLNIAGLTGDESLYIDGAPVRFSSGTDIELMSGRYEVRLDKPLYKPYRMSVEIKDGAVFSITPAFESNHQEITLRVGDASEIWIDGTMVTRGTGWTGRLEYGEHVVECLKESHRMSRMVLDVTPRHVGLITLQSPEPIYGTLMVDSTPAGCEVHVDGTYVGNTPYSGKVLVGQRRVSVSKQEYNSEQRTVTIAESETSNVNLRLSNIVQVCITSFPYADLYINGKKAGRTPYESPMVAGEYDIRLESWWHHDVRKTITVDQAHTFHSFKLKRQYYYNDDFVFGASFMAAGKNNLSVGGYAGVYLKGLYLEGSYHYGLNRSECIYWYDRLSENEAVAYSYRPMTIGGKVGYGIILGTRLRITPHAGAGLILLNGKILRDSSSGFSARSCYAVSVGGGVKFSYALASCIDLNIAPEYHHYVHKTDMYNTLYDVSPIIRSWDGSFRLNVGLGLYF